MALIRLQKGGLLVWSPFPPLAEVLEQVQSLKEPVKFVVAPNSLHWLGAVAFAQALAWVRDECIVLNRSADEGKDSSTEEGSVPFVLAPPYCRPLQSTLLVFLG